MMRMPRSVLLVAGAVLGLSGLQATAQADPAWQTVCQGGDIASGTYQNLRITGACTVPEGATVVVRHNLVVAAGGQFIADTAPSTVTIWGNVRARHGSYFGLGCTAAHGCEGGSTFSDTYVGGNINLKYVFDAALNGVEVGGNVRSQGGGAGFVLPEFIPFSVKDDVIHGNLTVKGLKTSWFGVIRTQVDGNVTLKYIKNDDPDGNEIVHDTIGGNLRCEGMSPTPQFGDADDDPSLPPDYPYSTVGGRVSGQCRFVLAPTS